MKSGLPPLGTPVRRSPQVSLRSFTASTLVSAAIHRTPCHRHGTRAIVAPDADGFQVRIRPTLEHRGHGFGNARHRATGRTAVELAPDIVGICRRTVGVDGREVSIGSSGEFRRHAGAPVIAVKVERHAARIHHPLRITQVAKVIIVFKVMAEHIGCIHGRARIGSSPASRSDSASPRPTRAVSGARWPRDSSCHTIRCAARSH